jgi:hypothetical protein
MKHMQTPSQMFIAVKLETTGNVLRKPFDVVKKFSIVVTPLWEKVGREKRNINDQEIDKKLEKISHGVSGPGFAIAFLFFIRSRKAHKKQNKLEEIKAILIRYLWIARENYDTEW